MVRPFRASGRRHYGAGSTTGATTAEAAGRTIQHGQEGVRNRPVTLDPSIRCQHETPSYVGLWPVVKRVFHNMTKRNLRRFGCHAGLGHAASDWNIQYRSLDG